MSCICGWIRTKANTSGILWNQWVGLGISGPILADSMGLAAVEGLQCMMFPLCPRSRCLVDNFFGNFWHFSEIANLTQHIVIKCEVSAGFGVISLWITPDVV